MNTFKGDLAALKLLAMEIDNEAKQNAVYSIIERLEEARPVQESEETCTCCGGNDVAKEAMLTKSDYTQAYTLIEIHEGPMFCKSCDVHFM